MTVVALLGTVTLLMSTAEQSQAGVMFHNRAAFESALTSFSVDNLDGITERLHSFDDRGDYTINSQQMWGTINHYGTGDNSPLGFDNAYMWTYIRSPDVFTFDTAITAFGFDYATPIGYNTLVSHTLNGHTNSQPQQPGFFGVIFNAPTTTVTMTQSFQYALYDNVTYSSFNAVPEPGSLAVFGTICLVGMVRRRQS